MDLYVNLLLDHFYTLYLSSSWMGMLFLVQNFTQLPKNLKVHVAHSLFLKKVLPSFESFENILPHLDTERKEKKRAGHHFAHA
jgi:hypothetical protein